MHVLKDTYDKLAAGYEGLELKWFANLRTPLRSHWFVAAWVGNPGLDAKFKGQVDELAQQIKSLSAHPSTDETRKIADHLVWLETFRQAPELVRETRQRFSKSNFHVQLGGELLGMGVGGPIDDVAPIDDVILGTVIHGTGRTVGQTKALLTPNPAFATFDAMLDAVNYSNNVGRNGPVCIYSTGQTCLGCRQAIVVGRSGLARPSGPGRRPSPYDDQQHRIDQGPQAGGADCLAAGPASSWARPRPSPASMPHAGLAPGSTPRPILRSRRPTSNSRRRGESRLDERRAFPRGLSFDTLASALEIHGAEALDSQLAAPSAPPELTRPADVTLRVHESAINNIAETVLTGMRLNDDMVQRAALELLGRLPEQLKPDENKEPFTIVFPQENVPGAAGHGLLRRQRGDDHAPRPGILHGRAEAAGHERHGHLQVRENAGRLSGPSAKAICKSTDSAWCPARSDRCGSRASTPCCRRSSARFLRRKSSCKASNSSSGKLAAAGQLVPQEIIAQDGWLAVGYCRTK